MSSQIRKELIEIEVEGKIFFVLFNYNYPFSLELLNVSYYEEMLHNILHQGM